MEIDVEIREIKELLTLLNRKMYLLIDVRETLSVMKVAESSLKSFFEEEPEHYSFNDLKVRYL